MTPLKPGERFPGSPAAHPASPFKSAPTLHPPASAKPAEVIADREALAKKNAVDARETPASEATKVPMAPSTVDESKSAELMSKIDALSARIENHFADMHNRLLELKK